MEEHETESPKGGRSDVEETSQPVRDAVERESQKVAGQAKERIAAEVSARKSTIAKELGNLGGALQVSAQKLDEENSALGPSIQKVAELCESSSSSIEQKGTRELVSRIEGFGREQPLLFFGAAVAAGLIATRLLRSDAGEARRTATSTTEEEIEETINERGFVAREEGHDAI